MDLQEYIVTNMMEKDEKEVFSKDMKKFLNSVFAPNFAEYLYKLYNDIDIVEKKRAEDLIAVTYLAKRIELNAPRFYALSPKERLEFLAHELIHLAINKGDAPRLKLLCKQLWRIYNEEKTKGATPSDIMVSKHGIGKKWIAKNETLPYLMTNDLNFDYMSEEGKKRVIDALTRSKLINIGSDFWKKRLSL